MLLQQSAVTVLLQRYSKLTYPLANLHYQKKMFFFFQVYVTKNLWGNYEFVCNCRRYEKRKKYRRRNKEID